MSIGFLTSISMRPRMVFCAIIGASAAFLGISHPLSAVPFEMDVTTGYSYRAPDSFDDGMSKFRTTLSPNVLSTATGPRYRDNYRSELAFRFGDVLGEHSFIGLTLGQYQSPDMSIRETRSDLAVFSVKYRFRIPFFLLTYGYLGELRQLGRDWKWEAGMGFGFVADPQWRMSGVFATRFQTGTTSAKQIAAGGNVLRLGGGIRHGLGEYGFLRLGLSTTYLSAYNFSGTVDGTDGTWYRLRNGAIAPVSSVLTATGNAVVVDPVFGPQQVSVIRDKVVFTAGLWELSLSVGFRL
ncbi:MAG: hypothetical protein HY042_04140 [Spirochaetia bacterium]|nr:hypothetical protein [Spirochaetia bacterium]